MFLDYVCSDFWKCSQAVISIIESYLSVNAELPDGPKIMSNQYLFLAFCLAQQDFSGFCESFDALKIMSY